MWQEKLKKNYECISDNSCNSIRRKKTKKNYDNWYMGVVFIRQPITDDHKLEWVFFIVYVKVLLEFLKSTLRSCAKMNKSMLMYVS